MRRIVFVGTLLAAPLVAGVAGCVLRQPAPQFSMQLPEQIEDDGRSIAIIGDLQMTPRFVRTVMRREDNRQQQALLIEDLHERIDDIAALLVVGDLVFTAGSRSDWAHFDRLIGPLAARLPILPAIGNHDYRCVLVRICSQRIVPARFRRRFDWFSPGQAYLVPFGDVLLVFLDSETNVAAQGHWLQQQLPDFEQRYRALLLLSHRPPYTDSVTGDVEPDRELLENVVPVLNESSLVSVFFSGHAHGYEHQIVAGRHYFVSAGGGGPRGWLAAAREFDVYRGPECQRDPSGRVMRPFNYVLLNVLEGDLNVSVRGFCRDDKLVSELESVRIPLTY